MTCTDEQYVAKLEQQCTCAIDDRRRLMDTWESLFGDRSVVEVYHELQTLRRHSRALTLLYEAIESKELEVETTGQVGRALDVARTAMQVPLA